MDDSTLEIDAYPAQTLQRTPSDTFLMNHSEGTVRFCKLLQEFFEIAQSTLNIKSNANREGSLQEIQVPARRINCSILVESRLEACIAEMGIFSDPEAPGRSWSACLADFESTIASIIPVKSPAQDNIDLDIPVDFFEDEFDLVDETVALTSTTGQHDTQSPAMLLSKSLRRPFLLQTLSNQTSPSKRSHNSSPPYFASKFIADEAQCSNADVDETGNNEESLTTSLAQFIDDRSQITKASQEYVGSHSHSPSSVDMMAFYRETAHNSQNDSRFAQPPKRFATDRNVLKFIHESSSPPKFEYKEDHSLEVLDWSSDLELN